MARTPSTQAIVDLAQKYLGVPYVWGGASPQGFDCSGFVMWLYGQQGIQLEHGSISQSRAGQEVKRSDLRPGDLVFFEAGQYPQGYGPGHVGLYIGNGKVIEAPHTGANVRVSTLADMTKRLGYVTARRLIPDGAPSLRTVVKKTSQNPQGQSDVLAYIADAARQRNLDPRAVIAVGMHEGLGHIGDHATGGGIGDGGTSFGPWQLHKGGAYPASAPQDPQAAQQWAWSKEGIDYALDEMAKVAAGQTGERAVTSIVRGFERPLRPDPEVASAIATYRTTKVPTASATVAATDTSVVGATGGTAPPEPAVTYPQVVPPPATNPDLLFPGSVQYVPDRQQTLANWQLLAQTYPASRPIQQMAYLANLGGT